MSGYTVEFGKNAATSPDGRLDAPAFHRNHHAIWEALSPFLAGKTGDVLEVGSGTGQHVVFFARQTPGLTWWPSDLHEPHLASIAAWRAHVDLANVCAPLRIDLAAADWAATAIASGGPQQAEAVFCANVIHIAPWHVAQGLMAGASELLRQGGRLFLYGPFKRGGRHTAMSNAVFDTSLRSDNPGWGVRDLGDVAALGAESGLALEGVTEMPANNLIARFSKL